MSASPIARQACSHAQTIPSRKVLLTDPSQMPDVYSSTPGGTLYSTTPGGEFPLEYNIPFHPLRLETILRRSNSVREDKNKGGVGGGAMIIIQAGFDNFSFCII